MSCLKQTHLQSCNRKLYSVSKQLPNTSTVTPPVKPSPTSWLRYSNTFLPNQPEWESVCLPCPPKPPADYTWKHKRMAFQCKEWTMIILKNIIIKWLLAISKHQMNTKCWDYLNKRLLACYSKLFSLAGCPWTDRDKHSKVPDKIWLLSSSVAIEKSGLSKLSWSNIYLSTCFS